MDPDGTMKTVPPRSDITGIYWKHRTGIAWGPAIFQFRRPRILEALALS